jgi:hypothetical protein
VRIGVPTKTYFPKRPYAKNYSKKKASKVKSPSTEAAQKGLKRLQPVPLI